MHSNTGIPNEEYLYIEDADVSKGSKRSRKQKDKSNMIEWKRFKTQSLREKGNSYVGRVKKSDKKYSEKPVDERKIGLHDVRKELFKSFWKNLSWSERKMYVASLVDCVVPKQKHHAESGDRRGATFPYYKNVGNEKKYVYRYMFCNTFGLSVWSVINWAKSVVHGMSSSTIYLSSQSKSLEFQGVSFAGRQSGIDSRESEREREKSFCSKIYPGLTENVIPLLPKDTKKLWNDTEYTKKCEDKGMTCLNRVTFSEVLNDMNMALYHVKRDLCDICCQYKVDNLTQKPPI
ncbi:hypothetical protein PR048_009673 [Dryococelus australis]|uniref:Uncharacterized protein n=1 Tax=Dryococelus australis TaxID=614101 RepID=A0ABQ9I1A9_9NEOP|nr:hypothetical protein PR048_009673 [Dryococelus australis]